MDINNFAKMIQISGIFGILAFVTVPVTMVLYFMYQGTPPVWNVLLRTLISMLALIFVLIFFSGINQIIKQSDKNNEWISSLIFNTVCIYLTTNFVAHSLEAGSVLNPQGMAVDATQDGILAQGNYLLYGSIGRIITATYMIAIGIVTLQTKIFPEWTGWIALVIGIINIAFIPSMFFGTRAGDFYSAIGWGNSAFAASTYIYWVFIISIIIIKDKHEYIKLIG
ncbi:hypothetical protein FACS189450_12500 [Spirochaetia bacterium]|nr:hypothetical protein FACS189450_12500 [Spirochaetia bacterium]